MGSRFELLKVSTFAAFLLAFVGVAIDGSHLANSDNQFVANTGAAIGDLSGAVSRQTTSLHREAEALALAATHKVHAMLDDARGTIASSSLLATNADADTSAAHLARVHGQAHVVRPPVFDRLSLRAQHTHRGRPRRVPEDMANREVPVVAPAPEWSGNLLDLPDFVTAEISQFPQRIVGLMHGGVSRLPAKVST